MNAPSMTHNVSIPSPEFSERAVLFQLICQEWRLCRGPVVTLGVVWLVGLWILVLFQHPAWLIAIGLWHVLFISPTQAGRDIIDGTEEFSFALPPGRTPLYVARMTPGLVFLPVIGLLGWLAIAYSLPQLIWSVFFSGGLTESFAPVTGFHWYAMAVLLPCAAHAIVFAIAANAGSRATVSSSGIIGIIAAAGVMLGGFFLENLLWQETHGFLAGPALLITTVLVLLVGHQAYRRKEATGSGGSVGTGNRSGLAWFIGVTVVLLLFVLASLFLFRAKKVVNSNYEMNQIEQQRGEQERREQQMRAQAMPTHPATPERHNP